MKEQLKELLSNVAPTLATALGGPLAGAAIGLISKRFTGDENSPKETILDSVRSAVNNYNTDPNVRIKLAELENEFKVAIEQEYTKRQEIASKNTIDARSMARHFNKLDAYLAITFSLLCVYLLFCVGAFYLMNNGVNLTDDQIMLMGRMFGTAETMLGGAIGFWFGKAATGGSR